MLERSVVCILIAAGLILSACTSITWSSPELSKLNETGGPLEGLLTSEESSWIGSLPDVGSIFGPFLGGFLANFIGRKFAYLTMAVPVIVGYTICAFARQLYMFYIARFLNGLALSALQAVNAIYVGEIARDEHRGMLSSVLLIALNSGVLLTYSVGPYTSVQFFNLLLAAVATIFFVLFLFVGVETPYYFILTNRYSKAHSSLKKIIKESTELLNQELEDIRNTVKMRDEMEKSGVVDLLKSKATIKSLVIAMGLFTFQQFSGSLAVLAYTQKIFEDAGTPLQPEISAVNLGILQLCACLYFPFILRMAGSRAVPSTVLVPEYRTALAGRKTILFCSALVMAVSEITLGIYFVLKESRDMSAYGVLPLVCLFLYIVAINNGVGNIPVVFLSEIFPDNVKASATSISIAWCWFAGSLVSRFFQPLSKAIGIGQCFIGFGIVCVFCLVFIHFVVIETKNKTLKEIQDELNH